MLPLLVILCASLPCSDAYVFQDKVYWANLKQQAVHRANAADGSDVETIVAMGSIGNPIALAIDEATCSMFISVYDTDGSSQILRAHLDGSGMSTFVGNMEAEARALFMEKSTRVLYWTTGNSEVRRANVDVYPLVVERATNENYDQGRNSLVVDATGTPKAYFGDYAEGWIVELEWAADAGNIAFDQEAGDGISGFFVDDWDVLFQVLALALDTVAQPPVMYMADEDGTVIKAVPVNFDLDEDDPADFFRQVWVVGAKAGYPSATAAPRSIALNKGGDSLFVTAADNRVHKISTAGGVVHWTIDVVAAHGWEHAGATAFMDSAVTETNICFTTTTTTTTSSTTISSTTTTTLTSTTTTTGTTSTTTATTTTATTSTVTVTTTTETVTTTTTKTTTVTTTSTDTVTSTTVTTTTTITTTVTTITETVTTTITTTTTSVTTTVFLNEEATEIVGIYTVSCEGCSDDPDKVIDACEDAITKKLDIADDPNSQVTCEIVTRRLGDVEMPRMLQDSSSLELEYTITVPTSTANAKSISTATFEAANFAEDIKQNMNTFLSTAAPAMVVLSADVPVPTLQVTVSLVGEIKLQATGVGSGDIKDAVRDRIFVSKYSLSSSFVEISVLTPAEAKTAGKEEVWIVSYKVKQAVVPTIALYKSLAGDVESPADFYAQLAAELEFKGANGIEIKTLQLPTYSDVTVTDACGTLDCGAAGGFLPSSAPTGLCEKSATCVQAQAACCEPLTSFDTTVVEVTNAASAASVAVVAGILIGLGCLIYAVRHCGKKKTKSPDTPRREVGQIPDVDKVDSKMGLNTGPAMIDVHSDEGSKTPPELRGFDVFDLQTPTEDEAPSVPKTLSPTSTARAQLNGLKGDWRKFADGKFSDEGIITIGCDGYTEYDGKHLAEQDLHLVNGVIARGDGWEINMEVSNEREVLWCKPGEKGVVWRRMKEIGEFEIDEKVKWTQCSEDVPRGMTGEIFGKADHELRVRFAKGARLHLSPNELWPAEVALKDIQLQQLLDGLEGEWRLFEGTTLFPGVVQIGQSGHAIYDGLHWPEQDLLVIGGTIARGDGWMLNPDVSNEEELLWCKTKEPNIFWKRVKPVSAYAVGDVVEWTHDKPEVPKGTRGQIVAMTDTRLRVRFPKLTIDVLASDILPLDFKAPVLPAEAPLVREGKDLLSITRGRGRLEVDVEPTSPRDRSITPPGNSAGSSPGGLVAQATPSLQVFPPSSPGAQPQAAAVGNSPTSGGPAEMMMVYPPGEEHPVLYQQVGTPVHTPTSPPSTLTPPGSPAAGRTKGGLFPSSRTVPHSSLPVVATPGSNGPSSPSDAARSRSQSPAGLASSLAGGRELLLDSSGPRVQPSDAGDLSDTPSSPLTGYSKGKDLSSWSPVASGRPTPRGAAAALDRDLGEIRPEFAVDEPSRPWSGGGRPGSPKKDGENKKKERRQILV